MKKFLLLILSFVLGLFAFVGCGESTGSEYEEVETVEYDITYYVVFDSQEPIALTDAYKVANVVYPSSYEKGVGATISELKSEVIVENVVYEFQGWYVDAACSAALTDNVISTTNTGKVTLFAKYASENHTPDEPTEPVEHAISYFVVINGAEPVAMTDEYKTQDGNYPASYEYGVGAEISNLNTDMPTADGVVVFMGWFENAACSVAFDGISATNTGDVTIYAKYQTVTYTVSYYVVLDGADAVALTDSYKVSGGEYPTSYEYGKEAEIDDLQDFTSGGKTYEFKGWYFDEDLTTAATITASTSGNKSVYAKYTEKVVADDDEENWTQNY
ncbi:MAG: InlB B-repeat-containing protein [Clostridia bacterium]|nr:InlB B-repeat-containing protein [Clostridia bacterium]